MYVEDAAEGILLATERFDKPDPVNHGTGEEITTRELVHLIAVLSGYEGKIMGCVKARWITKKMS